MFDKKQNNSVENLVVVAPTRLAFMAWEEDWKECFGSEPKVNYIIGSNNNWKKEFNNSNLNVLTYAALPDISHELIEILEKYGMNEKTIKRLLK